MTRGLALRINGQPVDWYERQEPKRKPRYAPPPALPVRFTPSHGHPGGNRHYRMSTEAMMLNREGRRLAKEYRSGKWVPRLGRAIASFVS